MKGLLKICYKCADWVFERNMAVCVAVIAKENYPLFLKTLPTENELRSYYTVHTSLDVVEEKISSGVKNISDPRELYQGLLYPTEDYKVYGYVTNTKIKFIIVVNSSNITLRDNEIRSLSSELVKITYKLRAYDRRYLPKISIMFRKLHNAYTDMVCNPFYVPGEKIMSKSFHKIVSGMMVAE